jgi:hypothetical protein
MGKDNLRKFLLERKDDIIEDACERYQALDQSHYERISYQDLVSRITLLTEAFLESLEEGREDTFLNYIKETGLRRLDEGYDLSELQRALWTFEDVMWGLIEENDASLDKIKCLRLISQGIGRVKDSLAKIVVDKMIEMESDMANAAEDFQKYLKKRKESSS